MYLVQLLLPVYDNSGERFSKDFYTQITRELTQKHGGVTAYLRSPAEGSWKDGGEVDRDQIVSFEVMVEELDYPGWAAYRKILEERFSQEALIVRATAFESL